MNQLTSTQRLDVSAHPAAGAGIAKPLLAAEAGLAILDPIGDPMAYVKVRDAGPPPRDPGERLQWARENQSLLASIPTANDEAQRAEDIRRALTGAPDRRATVGLIAMLLDSYPTGRPPNLAAYADAIVHDLVAMGYSAPVVALACQTLRRTSKWLPSVAEVLQAAQDAAELFASRAAYCDRIAQDIRTLEGRLALAEEIGG